MRDDSLRVGMQQPASYRISVEGWISDRRKDWFNGMAIALEGSAETRAASVLQGVVADQAALIGLLQNLYNLGFPLISVERLEGRPSFVST